MAEQRCEAVRAVIADGETVTDVAARFGVACKTVHAWLARYEAGLESLADRSHRPRSWPHQMTAAVECPQCWQCWQCSKYRAQRIYRPRGHYLAMHDGDMRNLREAAEAVENAHTRVTGMIGMTHLGFTETDPDHMTPAELHALREIDASLTEACTRLWNLVEPGS